MVQGLGLRGLGFTVVRAWGLGFGFTARSSIQAVLAGFMDHGY